jgi:hypothetical protein
LKGYRSVIKDGMLQNVSLIDTFCQLILDCEEYYFLQLENKVAFVFFGAESLSNLEKSISKTKS